MNMGYDIFSSNAVDLVIFTVAKLDSIRARVWDGDLISPREKKTIGETGLGLFVVTVPANSKAYPALEGRRLLPGGSLQPDEKLASAAKRIANDILGISMNRPMRQVGIFDDPHRDPNGRVLAFAYWAMVEFEEIRKYLGGREQIGLELVNSAKFMKDFEGVFGPLEDFDGVSRFGHRSMPSMTRGHNKTLTKDLPSGRILGLDHDEMVFYAWRALRHAFDSRLDPFRYLGVSPLGSDFRISDLQNFTEVCRGERIPRDLFRRRVIKDSKYLEPSGRTDEGRAGKPANLYKLNASLKFDEVEKSEKGD